MKILLLTGNHPRHLYLADTFLRSGLEVEWVIEKREPIMPQPEKELSFDIKKLFNHHFTKRAEVEGLFFGKNSGNQALKKIQKIFEIEKIDLINGKFKKLCEKIKADCLIAYGSGVIPEEILDIPKMCKWNVHLGLSPWYRGGATHFWPSYLLEPEFTGITVHEMTKDIDAGPIIHQQLAEINEQDGIHENACRLTKSFCEKFPIILSKAIEKKKFFKGIPQIVNGRNFTKKLWKPEMLKIVYELYEDKINKYCLDNNLCREVSIKTILTEKI